MTLPAILLTVFLVAVITSLTVAGRLRHVNLIQRLPELKRHWSDSHIPRLGGVAVFAALPVAPTAQSPRERAKAPGVTDAGKAALTEQMNAAVSRGDTPGVAEMVVNRDGMLFEGAAKIPVNSIFQIASMTKPVTSGWHHEH